MAKGQIALGKFRGKVGGQVLRVDAGIGQIISEYNPHPSNPRTVAQTNQRAKMVLAGKISAITPREAIAGLASNNRKARSLFVSNILSLAEISTVGNEKKATVSMETLVLSKGLVSPAQYEMVTAGEQGGVTVTITPPTGESNYNGTILVVYAGNGDEWIGCHYYALSKTDTTKTVLLSEFGINMDDGAIVSVFAIPVFAVDGAVSVAYSNILATQGSTPGADISFVRTIATAGGFGASQSVGTLDWE